MSGLPMRILSRRSVCKPFMTPMITISALTPTSTPPIAMTLISERRREPRRLRRYLQAIASSSFVMPPPSLGPSLLGPERGKEDHVADVRLVRQVHEES